jgi:glyoxylase-like metal-dependent hydrolase (beta-lactamase superfamily II)
VHVYLIITKEGAALVDCGLPVSLKRISKAIFAEGRELSAVRLIILTHAHYDHAGSAAALKEATGAELLCSTPEAPHLSAGWTPFPTGLNPYARLVSGIASRSMGDRQQFTPVEATIGIDDSYRLDSYGIAGRAIPTPGHSAGSLSLILDSGDAFVGDICFNIFPRSVVPPLADDIEKLLDSWRLLLESGAERFYPGHGSSFSREKLERSLPKLEKLVARKKK